MSKRIRVDITVNDTISAKLADLIEYLEENVVIAVAETADVPADFTQINASYRGEVEE